MGAPCNISSSLYKADLDFFLGLPPALFSDSSSSSLPSMRSARPDFSPPPMRLLGCACPGWYFSQILVEMDKIDFAYARRQGAYLTQFRCLSAHSFCEGHERLFEVFELLHCFCVR
jgi:hypothetical protein